MLITYFFRGFLVIGGSGRTMKQALGAEQGHPGRCARQWEWLVRYACWYFGIVLGCYFKLRTLAYPYQLLIPVCHISSWPFRLATGVQKPPYRPSHLPTPCYWNGRSVSWHLTLSHVSPWPGKLPVMNPFRAKLPRLLCCCLQFVSLLALCLISWLAFWFLHVLPDAF